MASTLTLTRQAMPACPAINDVIIYYDAADDTLKYKKWDCTIVILDWSWGGCGGGCGCAAVSNCIANDSTTQNNIITVISNAGFLQWCADVANCINNNTAVQDAIINLVGSSTFGCTDVANCINANSSVQTAIVNLIQGTTFSSFTVNDLIVNSSVQYNNVIISWSATNCGTTFFCSASYVEFDWTNVYWTTSVTNNFGSNSYYGTNTFYWTTVFASGSIITGLTLNKETLIGDWSTNVFAVSGKPSFLYQNGQYMEESFDYTYATPNVTFAVAPGNNARIVNLY